MQDIDKKIKILKNNISLYRFIITFFTFFMGVFLIILFKFNNKWIDMVFSVLGIIYLFIILVEFLLGVQDHYKIKALLKKNES